MSPTPFPFHGIFSSLGQGSDLPHEEGAQLQEPMLQESPATGGAKGLGQVAVDIYEHENYYIIKAPIAGVRLCDIDIEVNGNVVTIRGSRRQTDTIPENQYYLQECFWGEFSRSVTLPTSVDPKKVRATFNKESILKILIPKEEKVKVIRINEA